MIVGNTAPDSIYSHKAWDKTELSKMVEGGIPFPILSDITHSIGKLYEVYNPQKGRP